MDKVFDSLYSRFVLRDFFGKIVPGVIPIMVVWYRLANQDFSVKDIPFEVWVLLYGISWITGFALQSLGERLGGLRYEWKDKDNGESDEVSAWLFGIRYHAQKKDDLTGRSENQVFYDLRIEAGDKASSFERQEMERNVVIKEATGNASVALWISSVAWMVLGRFWAALCWRQILWEQLPILLSMLVGWVLLHLMHRSAVNRQDEFLRGVLEYRKDNPYKPSKEE